MDARLPSLPSATRALLRQERLLPGADPALRQRVLERARGSLKERPSGVGLRLGEAKSPPRPSSRWARSLLFVAAGLALVGLAAAGMKLSAVVAASENDVIGRGNALPWHLPADLAHFKRLTMGKPILMGRRTYESIGRPLPNRRNIVLTRDPEWAAPGVEVIHSPDELRSLDGEVFIIGGAQIYKAFSGLIDEWLVSHVAGSYEGDTWLGEFEHEFPESGLVESHPDFEVHRWRKKTDI
jgi:dihydrofolate reductase